MYGIYLADMLIALCRIPCKTFRWYLKIFWHLVDIAETNGWLLYKRHCKLLEIRKGSIMPLVNFIVLVAEALISAGQISANKHNQDQVGQRKEA